MIGPSNKALDEGREGFRVIDPEGRVREAAVRAAYPIIRADVLNEAATAFDWEQRVRADERSKAITEVVKALRARPGLWIGSALAAARLIEREFGGRA
jgi:hypothetical protein